MCTTTPSSRISVLNNYYVSTKNKKSEFLDVYVSIARVCPSRATVHMQRSENHFGCQSMSSSCLRQGLSCCPRCINQVCQPTRFWAFSCVTFYGCGIRCMFNCTTGIEDQAIRLAQHVRFTQSAFHSLTTFPALKIVSKKDLPSLCLANNIILPH